MRRCIQLARKAQGMTVPNPMVGCVIVCRGEIIGEGFHVRAGLPHAEVNAINSVKNPELLKDSTLYVSLEPCAHYGRTPPCSLLIIEKKIPRVVIGCIDSFSEVAGRGVEMLRQHGVEVITGVCENEARELNRRFFTFHEKKRPYIILKWAESADHFIDAERHAASRPVWLTNERSRMMVHKQRSEEGAILVGRSTALLDNPHLTVRQWSGNQPVRVVIDRSLALPQTLNMFNDGLPLIVINELNDSVSGSVSFVKVGFGSRFEQNLMSELYNRGIQSVIVEGGSITIQSLIDHSLWDEAFVYQGDSFLRSGVPSPILPAEPVSVEQIDNVRLFIFRQNYTRE